MKHLFCFTFSTICFLCIFVAGGESVEFSKVSSARLDNGLELVFVENHANPILMSAAIVKAGSRFESDSFSGASHMLEHLLFNGTTNRTQEELYAEADLYGIYNNAMTNQHCTTYLMLGPSEYSDKILELQSDMLFNSTLPEEKFEKERGIVIEEINKDNDRKENLAELLFQSVAYPLTPYALPVLGTIETIQNMSRQRVKAYYKAHYVPGNMTLVLMGDFDTEQLLDRIKKSYYGTTAGVSTVPQILVFLPNIKKRDRNIRYLYTETERAYLKLSFNAPKITEPDWAPFTILTEIISKRLDNHLSGDFFLEIGANYDFNSDFGRMLISGTAKSENQVDEGMTGLVSVLNDIGTFGVKPEEVQNVITRQRTEEFFLAERLHHYAMMKASLVATGGWEFCQTFSEKLAEVSVADINSAAKKFFSQLNYTGIVLAPGESNFTLEDFSPIHQLPENKIDPRTRGDLNIDLTARPLQLLSESETSIKSYDQKNQIKKHVLENGLTVIIDQNQNSRVFATHLMAKNRSLNEPAGKSGIADVLHRMFLLGTESKNKEELDNALDAIGTEVRVTDRDFIPFDDYYTTPEFSFVRLNTIDDFYSPALELLAEMITQPKLSEENLQIAKDQLINVLRRKGESVQETARRVFYQKLFGDHPLAHSPFGTIESVESITLEEIKQFHTRYFAANNLVLSVVTNMPADEALTKIEAQFDSIQASEEAEKEVPKCPSTVESTEIDQNEERGRAQIYIGTLFPVEEGDQAALKIATSILSDRMAFDLRETRGWAYRLGASISLKEGVGRLTLGMGTSSSTKAMPSSGMMGGMGAMGAPAMNTASSHVSEATAAMREHVTAMAELSEIDSLEVEKAINSMIYRAAMRQMAREGQAYGYAMCELSNKPLDHYTRHSAELRAVTPEEVIRVAQTYFKQENWLTVVAQ